MAKFIIREHVEAAPETVFAVASDFRQAAENIKGIIQLDVLTDGPIGQGTRFRETRTLFGKEATEEMEVTLFDEPHRYVVESASCGMHYRAEYTFVADIAGTHVRLEMESHPANLMAKLLAPLMTLVGGPMKKLLAADLQDVKTVAEAKTRQPI